MKPLCALILSTVRGFGLCFSRRGGGLAPDRNQTPTQPHAHPPPPAQQGRKQGEKGACELRSPMEYCCQQNRQALGNKQERSTWSIGKTPFLLPLPLLLSKLLSFTPCYPHRLHTVPLEGQRAAQGVGRVSMWWFLSATPSLSSAPAWGLQGLQFLSEGSAPAQVLHRQQGVPAPEPWGDSSSSELGVPSAVSQDFFPSSSLHPAFFAFS